MELVCQRITLLEALQTTALVVPTRSPKPILRYVRLARTEEGLVLEATDMEISCRLTLEGEVRGVETLPALLPATRLLQIVGELTSANVIIKFDGNGITVKADRSTFQLQTAEVNEFPVIDLPMSATNYCQIPARAFRHLVRHTLFACDVESSRYALGGVCLECDKGSLTAIATDGRRLTLDSFPSVFDGQPDPSTVIIPRRALQVADRVLGENSGDSQLTISGNNDQRTLSGDGVTVRCRLLEGRFPKWRDILPDRSEYTEVSLLAGQLHRAIRQAAVVASEESRGLDFAFREGTLAISARTAQVGESEVELPISYTGEPVTVTLDHRFVADWLKTLEPEDQIRLQLRNGQSAVLLEHGETYRYVVMPIAHD